jgi:hypothetical protein
MSNRDYPRTAIVSANPLRGDLANGIFMRSLFAEWPKERLSQIYFPVGATYLPDRAFCHDTRMIRLSGKTRRFLAEEKLTAAPQQSPARSALSSTMRRRASEALRMPRVFRWAKLAQEVWYSRSWMRVTLERELRDLRPEIVFALLGNYCLTKITVQACERLGIPVYAQITDDFMQSLYEGLPFNTALKSASMRWTQHAVDYASGRSGISPIMAESYQQRFGKSWSWFTTLVDREAYDPTPRAASTALNLVFAGNLGLRRWSTLRQVGEALRALKDSQGLDSRLRIFAPEEQLNEFREALSIPGIIELSGWTSPDKLPGIFQDADILVHVESFDSEIAAYTELSFSTKISQYMMAGRCILAVGPERLGSIEMIRRTAAGCVVTECELSSLIAAIQPILEDGKLRSTYGTNGRRWATEFVESKTGRERFRCDIVASVKHYRERIGQTAI